MTKKKMKIEIGKEYMISPKYKKCFVQKEIYENNDGDKVIIESVWRNGQYIVEVNCEEEKELLEKYMTEIGGDMEPDEFEENEFVSSYDECAQDTYVILSNSDEVPKEIIESVEEGGYEWLEENEFVSSYDECAQDTYVILSNSDEVPKEIIESVEEGGYEWLEENGYEPITMEHYLGLPLEVNEVDPNNRYNLND